MSLPRHDTISTTPNAASLRTLRSSGAFLVRRRPARSHARRGCRNRGRPALAGSGHRGSRRRSRCARSTAGRRQESCIRGQHVDTPRRTLRKRLRDIPFREDHLEMLVDRPPRHFERISTVGLFSSESDEVWQPVVHARISSTPTRQARGRVITNDGPLARADRRPARHLPERLPRCAIPHNPHGSGASRTRGPAPIAGSAASTRTSPSARPWRTAAPADRRRSWSQVSRRRRAAVLEAVSPFG